MKVGEKINRWTLLEVTNRRTSSQEVLGLFECECGTVKDVAIRRVVSGRTKSCGCLKSELVSKRATKHGLSEHPLYFAWHSMIRRVKGCTEKHRKNYASINVHPSFETLIDFIKNAPDGWFPGAQLDRIDNNKDYEPGNVRWADRITQANNKSNNVHVEDPNTGEQLTVAELARKYDLPYHVAIQRYNRGIREESLIAKLMKRKK